MNALSLRRPAMPLLAADVAREEEVAAKDSVGMDRIWSPYGAFEDAATHMRVLDEVPAA